MNNGGKAMTTQAAARIQGATAKAGNGQVAKGSFGARATAAAARNTANVKSGKK